MQTAGEAKQASNDALTGLTFIDTLISGATLAGLYRINVDGNNVTAAQKQVLLDNGYAIAVQLSDGNPNWPRYLIGWG